MSPDPLETIGALSALDDPTRRRAYEYVARQNGPVTRDDVAGALEIGRTLAAYHLDRLAAGGLLEVGYQRRSGRTGPGAGRPAKVYERSPREVAVSVPPRDYGLAAQLLAHAAAHDEHGDVRRALRTAARELGRETTAAGREGDTLEPLLRERGYEPFDDHGVLRMRNCPFHAAAQRQPEVVCDLNLALIGGMLSELGERKVKAVLEPGPGRCCVALRQDG